MDDVDEMDGVDAMIILQSGTNRWWHGLEVQCVGCGCRLKLEREDAEKLRFMNAKQRYFDCPECGAEITISQPLPPEELDRKIGEGLTKWRRRRKAEAQRHRWGRP